MGKCTVCDLVKNRGQYNPTTVKLPKSNPKRCTYITPKLQKFFNDNKKK